MVGLQDSNTGAAGQQRPQQVPPSRAYAAQQPQQQYPVPMQAAPVVSEPRHVFHILDKRMIIPLVVIIFLLLAAFLVYTYVFKDPSVETGTPQTGYEKSALPIVAEGTGTKPSYCDDMVARGDFSSQDACFEGLAVKNKNPEYCKGVSEGAGRDGCFSMMSARLLNPDYCYEIDEAEGSGSSSDCLLNVALATYDVNICFSIPYDEGEFSVNHCIFKVAVRMQDSGLCDLIGFGKEPYSKNLCVSAVEEGAQGAAIGG